ncbi:MAG: hypothetical protein H6Q33_1582, partial [Deltaproteobacteria bacterium]|nr:hypothetical protein [Deltaproteobacteria bacterium]
MQFDSLLLKRCRLVRMGGRWLLPSTARL